ncbi:MAG: adenylate kinase [Parcubacteria group bacterium Greene0714_36]|nr:MAG: adenylate kinase [Parcubacteria group bacterium Greene0714_36]
MTITLKDKLTIVVLGRSGSGKGTQAKFILARLRRAGVFHLETGRFLRDLMERKNVTTELAEARLMKRGDLFPWWFPIFLWMREIIAHGHADGHLIGDGTPRRLSEAHLIDEMMVWHGRPQALCVYVDVSRREARRRLLARKRGDDTPDAIENRLDYFPRDVVPVLRYYRRHGRLVRVNGVQTPARVAQDIDVALAKHLGRRWPRASR